LGGVDSNAIFEIIQWHDCEDTSVVGVLNDNEPGLIQAGVKEALGVAATLLGGNRDGEPVIQKAFQIFRREFATLAQAHLGVPRQF